MSEVLSTEITMSTAPSVAYDWTLCRWDSPECQDAVKRFSESGRVFTDIPTSAPADIPIAGIFELIQAFEALLRSRGGVVERREEMPSPYRGLLRREAGDSYLYSSRYRLYPIASCTPDTFLRSMFPVSGHLYQLSPALSTDVDGSFYEVSERSATSRAPLICRWVVEGSFGVRRDLFPQLLLNSPAQAVEAWMDDLRSATRTLHPRCAVASPMVRCVGCRTAIENPKRTLTVTNEGVLACERCRKMIAVLAHPHEDNKSDRPVRVKKPRTPRAPRTIITLEQKIPITPALRRALYRSYHGQCEYCHDRTPIPIASATVEHIIPRAVDLAHVPKILAEQHRISARRAVAFCKHYLPPVHDCLANLAIACERHNREKRDGVLHLTSLELLFRTARRRYRRTARFLAGYSAANEEPPMAEAMTRLGEPGDYGGESR